MTDLAPISADDAPPEHVSLPDHHLTGPIIGALKGVYDPEIPVNIYDLGLIYRLDVAPCGAVSVDMTLTVPNCPVADTMPEMVREAVLDVDGVTDCNVNLVWEPRWDPSKMSEVARLALDIY